MRKFLLPALAAGALYAQAPIDNDQAHVIIAHEQPHKKTALHQHKYNRVMVYLDAGQQDIVPQSGPKQVLNFKPGDVKWSPAGGMHTSEVVSTGPVTIVEVEVKKPGPGKTVTTSMDPLKVDPQDYKLEFENDQVRVVRVHMPAHRQVPTHEHTLNRVVIYLTDQNGRMTATDGKVDTATHKPGEASWGAPVTHKEENLMDKPFEAIVVEFKS